MLKRLKHELKVISDEVRADLRKDRQADVEPLPSEARRAFVGVAVGVPALLGAMVVSPESTIAADVLWQFAVFSHVYAGANAAKYLVPKAVHTEPVSNFISNRRENAAYLGGRARASARAIVNFASPSI